MFYIKSGDLYYAGEFDRSLPPDCYVGTLDEALGFETREDAERWAEEHGGVIIEDKDVPEVDFWRGEHHKACEQLREIANLVAFDYDTMLEDGRKKFFELIKEIAFRYQFMNWTNIKDKEPGDGEEVFVWIDGHRGPSWRNDYALVAYRENGYFWEERHPSHKPLEGVIKWAYIEPPIL